MSGRDVSGLLTDDGFTVLHSQIVLNRPIKEIGLHEVEVSLHPEVRVGIVLNVARSEGEAVLQAKGEDVLAGEVETDGEETVIEEFFEEGAAPDEAADGASDEESDEESDGGEDGKDADEAAPETADTEASATEKEDPAAS